MHHKGRCTTVLSIWIQGSKKIATRLLAALILTCSVSISTRTTSTDSRPINFYSRMGHKKTSFVWQESLFNKISKQNVLPLCLSPSNSSRIDTQSWFQSWEKLCRSNRMNNLEKECVVHAWEDRWSSFLPCWPNMLFDFRWSGKFYGSNCWQCITMMIAYWSSFPLYCPRKRHVRPSAEQAVKEPLQPLQGSGDSAKHDKESSFP